MTNTTNYTLHTHTVGFDGRNTAIEMINTARDRGFKTIGFSNHFIVHPGIYKSKMYQYAVRGGYANIYSDSIETAIGRFLPHYQEVRALRAQYPDMNILLGMEMDYFRNPAWADNMAQAIRVLQPDYVIGATHFIEHPDFGIMNVHDMKNAPMAETRHLVYAYYDKLAALAGLNWNDLGFRINWIAHFDLPKKVGLHNPVAECAAIQAISKNNMPIELNTALIKNKNYLCYCPAWNKIAEMNIPVILSDDAHDVSRIGANFDEVAKMAQEFGIKNICYRSDLLNKFVKIHNH